MNRTAKLACASVFALLSACSSSSGEGDTDVGALTGDDDELPRPAFNPNLSPLSPDTAEHQLARVLEVKRPTGDESCRAVRLVSVGPPLDAADISGQTLYVVTASGAAHRVGAFEDSSFDCVNGVISIRETGQKLELNALASAPACDLGNLCSLLNGLEASFAAFGDAPANFEAANVLDTTRGDAFYVSLWSPSLKKDQVYRVPKQDLGKVAAVSVKNHALHVSDANRPQRTLALTFKPDGATVEPL